MAVSVPTSGYAVNVMPQASLPNPQLFDIYGDFGASIARGQQQGAQLIDIVEQARLAPLRREQAQIQLQDAVAAQNRRQIMEPLEVARYRQQLAQPVETITGSEIQEFARPADATGAVPAGFDIREMNIVDVYDPMTNTRNTVRRPGRILSTLEQQAEEQNRAALLNAQINAANALADQRRDPKMFRETALLEELRAAEAAGDIEGAGLIRAMLSRPSNAVLSEGTTAARRYETMGANAGFTIPQIQQLSQSPVGVSLMNKLATRNALQARGDLYAMSGITLTPEEEQLRISIMQTPSGTVATEQVSAAPMMQPLPAGLPSGGATDALARMQQERAGGSDTPFDPRLAARAAAQGGASAAPAAPAPAMPPQFNTWSPEQKELYNFAIQNPNDPRSQRAFRALGIQ